MCTGATVAKNPTVKMVVLVCLGIVVTVLAAVEYAYQPVANNPTLIMIIQVAFGISVATVGAVDYVKPETKPLLHCEETNRSRVPVIV